MSYLLSLLAAVALTADSKAAEHNPVVTGGVDGWHRLVSPDGAVAVLLPCEPANTTTRTQGGIFEALCLRDGAAFSLRTGTPPKGAPFSAGFDKALAEARSDKNAGAIAVVAVNGHRAFTVLRNPKEALGRAEIVELRRGELVLLAVFEEPQGALSAADRAGALASGQAYTDSLEILAK